MNKKHGEPHWSWTQMLARLFVFDSCRKFSSIFMCNFRNANASGAGACFFPHDIAWSIGCIWGRAGRGLKPQLHLSRHDCVAKALWRRFRHIAIRQQQSNLSKHHTLAETCSIADHGVWLRTNESTTLFRLKILHAPVPHVCVLVSNHAPILSSVHCQNESHESNWSFPTLNRWKPTTTVYFVNMYAVNQSSGLQEKPGSRNI